MAITAEIRSQGVCGGLRIVVSQEGIASTIQLEGDWDLAALSATRRAVSTALEHQPEYVVLDLRRLSFLDSSGVHATIELAKRATAQNFRLVIMPGPPVVQRIFELCGLTELLPFVDQLSTPSRVARFRNARFSAAGPGGPSLATSGADRLPEATSADI